MSSELRRGVGRHHERVLLTRTAEMEDVREINSAIQNTGGPGFYKAMFSAYHLPTLLDTSYLASVSRIQGHETEDNPNLVEGFVTINDSIPLMPDPQSFDKVVNALKNFIPITHNNITFITFWMIAAVSAQIVGSAANLHHQQKDEVEVAYSIITDIFTRCPHLDFILWICPGNFVLADHIQQLFSSLPVDSAEDAASGIKKMFQNFKILFLHRSRFLPKLFVRPARVEDNDDLIPIIQHSSPEILNGQDHFFLADLIQRGDQNNRYFVGLRDNDIPVGMLATGVDVNMSLITKIFDVDIYQDLVIQSDQAPLPPPLLINIIGDIRLIDLDLLTNNLDGDHCHILNFEQMRVDWRKYQHDYQETYESAIQHNEIVPSMLQSFLQHVTSQVNDPELQAIILWGLPGTEEDAQRLMAMISTECNVILELVNTSEDAEEDEEDEYLQRHLDAVEVLREFFFMEENTLGSFRTPFSNEIHDAEKRAQWRKISFDKETALQLKHENIQRFYGALSICFDDRNERIERAKQLQQEKPPAANGFAITALCMEEAFLSRSIDLLKLAFEEQPHLAYCLYMLPNDLPPSPATQAFNFVKTRPGVSFDQSLYIIHKSFFYVSEHLHVERLHANLLKEDSLQAFLSPLHPSVKLSFQEEMKLSLQENDIDILDNPSQATFTVLMGDNVVGLFTLSRKVLSSEDVNWFRAHYHLDEHVAFTRHRLRSQYQITSWLLDPVFSHYTRLVLQHVLRKCQKTVLYFHAPDKEVAPPKEILEEFVFVRPRRRAQGEHQPYRQRPSVLALQATIAAAEAEARAAAEAELARDNNANNNNSNNSNNNNSDNNSTNNNNKNAGISMSATEAASIQLMRQSVAAMPREDSPLFCLTKTMLAHRKTIVAKRMVVVGGSSHSFAFLETFTSSPAMYYPNVYFIVGVLPTPFRAVLSPSSSSATTTTVNAADTNNSAIGANNESANNTRSGATAGATVLEDDFSGCLTPKDVEFPLLHELWALAYPHRINVLKGHLTDIDREHRAVVVSDEVVLEYDFLLLSSALVDHSARRIASLAQVHPAKCADAGIFGLGNPAADLLAVQWAQRRTANKNDPIVISGGAIQVLTAAEGLIRAGVAASKIICVTQDYDHSIAHTGDNNAQLCRVIAETVARTKVTGLRAFLWRCEVSEVVLSRNGFIQAVDIRCLDNNNNNTNDSEESKSGPQIVRIVNTANNNNNNSNNNANAAPRMMMQKEPCAGLFLCDSDETMMSCERDVFGAINDCGLVFDGGIIVDLNFRTVDPHIYAVCDFAKFSRVYRHELPIKRYNPREVGMHVALQVLYRHFHPLLPRLSPTQIAQTLRGVTPSAFATQATQGPTPQQPHKRSSSAALSYNNNSSNNNSQQQQHIAQNHVRFTLGRATYSFLAGDLYYFYASLPSLSGLGLVEFATDNLAAHIHRFGRPPPQHVTSLKISGLGLVAELAYIGCEPIEYRNFSVLLGKHEAYLNAAVHAHEKGNVNDWVEFFRDTWATAVYLDSFHFLLQAVRRNLVSDKGMISLLGRIFERAEKVDEDAELADYRRNIIGPHGEQVNDLTMKTIETSALDYLRDNADFLPHFYLKSRDQK